MALTPQDFVSKWKRVNAREKQIYQEHFLDLCHLVGHPTPNESDPSGKRFGGRDQDQRWTGLGGCCQAGLLRWEYKGKDADLEKAYDQLLH